MSVHSYDTVIEHTSDITFRAWGAAFKAGLIAAGLTPTTDSGQIDWTTATIPGAGSYAGYECYRFDDALQGTAPIFIRFDYGTGGDTTYPRISVQVGDTIDGSGSLTGSCKTDAQFIFTSDTTVVNPGTTPYPTFINYNPTIGFLGIAFKLGAAGVSNAGYGFMFLGRSCDSTGAVTNDGATLITGGQGTVYSQSLNFDGNTLVAPFHRNYGQVIGNPSSSLVGANLQAYLLWANYPRVEPINWACMVIKEELSRVTFSAALVGADEHLYLSLGINSPNPSQNDSNSGHYAFAMLYE